MHDSTIIPIDLPKLPTKPVPKPLHNPFIPSFAIPPRRRPKDQPPYQLIVRYKTQLNDNQTNRFQNQFMDLSSGSHRITPDRMTVHRKSNSFISAKRDLLQENHQKELSINLRRRRLPKLMVIKAGRAKNDSKNEGSMMPCKLSLHQKMQLVTFYPHKQQQRSQTQQGRWSVIKRDGTL